MYSAEGPQNTYRIHGIPNLTCSMIKQCSSNRFEKKTVILTINSKLTASDHVTETVAGIILLLFDIFIFRCKHFLSHRARIGS